MANNRYDEDRERFEAGRGQDAGRRRDFDRGNQSPEFGGNARPDWARRNEGGGGDYEGRNFESQGPGDRQNYGGNYSNYGGNESLNYGTGSRNFGNQPQFGGGSQSGQDWDRYRQRSMTSTYPRQNEWSSEQGIASGLGGAENSEYSSSPRSGNPYFGQNQFGGGLNQAGSGSQGQFGGGLGQSGEQGRHHGKGPKGYKRSDERIREDVNERLTQDPHIDATDIEVQVKDGEVTLTGMVESRQLKRRAEEMIENLSGVRDVHNQLRAQSSHDTGTHKEPAGASKGSGKA